MRLLLVNIYFRPDPTGTGWLLSELADSLAEMGHDVRVVTAQTHYGVGKAEARAVSSEVGKPRYLVRRTWVYRPANMTAARRLANYASFTASASKAILREPRPDAILTTWPTLAVAGIVPHAKRWKVPLVLNLQDIAPVSLPVSRLALRANSWIERRALRRVDRVITLTETMRDRCVSCGVGADRVTIIPNWVDTGEITPRASCDAMRAELGVTGQFVVLSPGNIGLFAGYDAILDAAGHLRDRPDIVFVIAGQGHGRQHVEHRVAQERLANVKLISPVPRERFAALLSCANVGLVSREAAFVDENVPYRALPIMAAGKPVVAMTDRRNEIARVAVEHECGWHVDPRHPRSLAETVTRVAADHAELSRRGQNARRHVEVHHDRKTAAARYADAIAHACEVYRR